MGEQKIPLYKVYWDQDDVEAVTSVVKRGTFWVTGPEIDEFERNIATYTGTRFAVSFNSGTSALHALMLASGLKNGDEVIAPSFSFIATANAPLFVGARPVFSDIETETYGLDVESVRSKISTRTKAVIPIHYGGLTCRMISEIRELTAQKGVYLFEDAAESIGSTASGKKAGSFGDAAVFSFCGNKVISCGEGGAVVTDNGELYEKLKLVRSHGRLEKEPYFLTFRSLDYIQLGYNWRMSSITASLGLSQLRKLERVVEMRRKIAGQFADALGDLKEVELPQEPRGFRHIYQMYTIKVKDGKRRRDALRQFLSERGIMSKVYFDPIHMSVFYKELYGLEEGSLPVTEKVSTEVLTLPIYPGMSEDEVGYVTKAVHEFFATTN